MLVDCLKLNVIYGDEYLLFKWIIIVDILCFGLEMIGYFDYYVLECL